MPSMLLKRAKPTDFAGPSTVRGLSSPAALFSMLVGVIRRQFLLIVLIAVSALGLGFAYLIITPSEFTATALLLSDSRRIAIKGEQSTEVGYDPARMESQVYVVRSATIALAVIKDLHLTEDPDLVGKPGLIGMLVGPLFRLFETETPPSELQLTRTAVDAFTSRLTVRRIGLSYILEISFMSQDAARAAQIANAVAKAYIDNQLDARYQVIKHANGWMQERIRELAEQSSAAQRAVVEFKTKNDIVDAGGRLTSDQQLAELNTQLVAARTQTSDAKAKLERIESLLSSNSPESSVDATVADTLRSEVITRLRNQYLDYQRRVNEWTPQYGPDHLAVIHARDQMQAIRVSIFDELRRIAETYKSDYDIAQRKVSSSEAAMARAVAASQLTNVAQVALHELDSNAQTYRSLYDNFLQRYMEAIQQLSFPITEASVVAEASPPLHRSHPRTLLVLAFSLGGGLIFAVGAGLLRDRWYPVFRSSAEVEDAFQVGCLAVLPLLEVDESKVSMAGRRATLFAATPTSARITPRDESVLEARPPDARGERGREAPRRIIRSGNGPLWHVAKAPLSPFTESIRSIKLAVDHHRSADRTKVIGITSASPHEGKSTVAGALAILMAQTGARTVLVDCDLRNPSLTRALAPEARLGLLDVILQKAEIDDVTWTDETGTLTFLPGVVNERLAHSIEFLASSRATALIEMLRERYDNVVVDLSPLTPVVDVRATEQLIDAYVLVVEWGRTRVDQVERALRDAPGLYNSLLGVVLNKAPPSAVYPGGRRSHYSKYYYGGADVSE
jgi:succinoglycan biosynthesis transport protein ExoP